MFKILAVNDEQNFCECCGRKNLKRVVWIENLDTGEIKHFGTTCAMSPSKEGFDKKEIKKAISAHQNFISGCSFATNIEFKKQGGKFLYKGDGKWIADNKELWNSIFLKISNERKTS